MRQVEITIRFELADEDFNSQDFQDDVVNPMSNGEAEEAMTEDWQSIRNFESKIEVR